MKNTNNGIADIYNKAYPLDKCVNIQVGDESVSCIVDVSIDTDAAPNPLPNSIGTAIFQNRKSRYVNESCSCAFKFVQVTDEHNQTHIAELYTECFPGDVPGVGHYDENSRWVWDNKNAAKKFLIKALEHAETKAQSSTT